MAVRIENNLKNFGTNAEVNLGNAVERMALDVKLISKVKVPYKAGTLQGSCVKQKLSRTHHQVIYDTDYASYQERGSRKNGTRVVKNYSTPGTSKGFLKQAGVQVSKNALSYMKQAAARSKA